MPESSNSPQAPAGGTVVVAGASFPSLDTERSFLEPLGCTIVDKRFAGDDESLEACRTAVAVMTDYFVCDATRIATFERCRVICQYGAGSEPGGRGRRDRGRDLRDAHPRLLQRGARRPRDGADPGLDAAHRALRPEHPGRSLGLQRRHADAPPGRPARWGWWGSGGRPAPWRSGPGGSA